MYGTLQNNVISHRKHLQHNNNFKKSKLTQIQKAYTHCTSVKQNSYNRSVQIMDIKMMASTIAKQCYPCCHTLVQNCISSSCDLKRILSINVCDQCVLSWQVSAESVCGVLAMMLNVFNVVKCLNALL